MSCLSQNMFIIYFNYFISPYKVLHNNILYMYVKEILQKITSGYFSLDCGMAEIGIFFL